MSRKECINWQKEKQTVPSSYRADSIMPRMGEISVPVLIIHGTEDPALPYEHGLALAKAIPQAELMTLDGSGHEIHSDDWDMIIESVIKLTSR
ncbi:alpha/beta fold hydrolase [Peribacillus frigoritolerans]|uniref:alpha/beta fold hydrolase n=1 Tax=Peribacillus frigoritolerans TaxID=450367 RepID=UPI001EFC3AED|nr:alpha/beta hydrolase [Peribacillus frigoritolerans]ULM96149.1 alpha/beta fold hydrolase [Peribacillus frigoritolerans]